MYEALSNDQILELDRKMWSAYIKANHVWCDPHANKPHPLVQEMAGIGYEVTEETERPARGM